MKLYRLHKKQNFPISVETAWEFLSNPKNLKTITPEYMSFDIISGADRPMYALNFKWIKDAYHLDSISSRIDKI